MTYDDLITALEALPPGAKSALVLVEEINGNVGDVLRVQYEGGMITLQADLEIPVPVTKDDDEDEDR
jgi:hypothetical protein